jgi:hypothetical protein
MQNSIAYPRQSRFLPAQEPFRHSRVSLNGSDAQRNGAIARTDREESADL